MNSALTPINGDENIGFNSPSLKKILVAKHSDCLTIPDPDNVDPVSVSTDDEMANLVKISSDIIMDVGKSFLDIGFLQNTASMSSADVGEMGGMHPQHTLTFIMAKSDARRAGFRAMIQNEKLIFLVKDRNDNWRVFGDKDIGVYLQAGEGSVSPAEAEGRQQTSFTFLYDSNVEPCFFSGDVLLTDVESNPGGGGSASIIS